VFSIEICIDVHDLEHGVRFYGKAFGFTKVAEPYSGVAVLHAGAAAITLLEKREGSRPSPKTLETRHYDRHWTPVHLDFHVDDVRAALNTALAAGATQEQFFESSEHGPAAFCADPFGNGFCILQRKPDRP
jgi:predicted enzyme related to lactoylglutathione lyase